MKTQEEIRRIAEEKFPYDIEKGKPEHVLSQQIDAEIYIQGFTDGQEQDEWISVVDKHPLYNETVLFYSKKFNMARMGRVDYGVIVYNGSRYLIGEDITHWRPLPQPPKTK